MGGALTAVAPDFTRASLGVGGMNYSVLLNRSVDFDQYAQIAFEPAYTDELERPLVLSIVQMLWDRGEANGYAHRMTDDPLPNTPAHEVLMNVGFGDHQVSTFTADTRRGRSAPRSTTRSSTTAAGRTSSRSGTCPRIGSYPYTGSALVYWDSGPIRDDPTRSTRRTCSAPTRRRSRTCRTGAGRTRTSCPRRTARRAADGLRLPAARRAEPDHRHLQRRALLRLHVQRPLIRLDLAHSRGGLPGVGTACCYRSRRRVAPFAAPERFTFLAAPRVFGVYESPRK